jgi:hypothetical protein
MPCYLAVVVPPSGLLEAGHEVLVKVIDACYLVKVVKCSRHFKTTHEVSQCLLYVPDVLKTA